MRLLFNLICSNSSAGAQKTVDPLYQALDVIGPVVMGIVALLGVLWGIILGTKFAQATDSKEKAALQKALINGIIGFVAIFILVTILYAIRVPLINWMES